MHLNPPTAEQHRPAVPKWGGAVLACMYRQTGFKSLSLLAASPRSAAQGTVGSPAGLCAQNDMQALLGTALLRAALAEGGESLEER